MLYLFLISIMLLLFSVNLETSSINLERKHRRGTVSSNKLKYIVVFSLLLFITMFRGENIGNDTQPYMYYFKLIAQNGLSRSINFEFGYQLFNIAVSKFSNDPRAIIIATSVLSYSLFGAYFYKKCKNPFLAIVFFYALFFSVFTNVIRMSCSISFLLWAYDSISNKKILRSVFFTALALLFHSTSIVFVLFEIIIYYDIKISTKVFGIFSMIMAMLCLSSDYVLDIIRSLVGKYGGRFADSTYLFSDRTETGFWGVAFSIFILGVMYLCYAKIVAKKDRKESTKWLFAFSLLFYILSFVMNLFDRLAVLFLFVLIVPMINEMMDSQTSNKRIRLVFLIGFLLSTFLIKVVVRPEWNSLYPYTFMWQ